MRIKKIRRIAISIAAVMTLVVASIFITSAVTTRTTVIKSVRYDGYANFAFFSGHDGAGRMVSAEVNVPRGTNGVSIADSGAYTGGNLAFGWLSCNYNGYPIFTQLNLIKHRAPTNGPGFALATGLNGGVIDYTDGGIDQ